MKNILIIYPHWPPSNLAGVHRARLISNFLPEFGWHPIILTVKAEYYEEKPDPDIAKTVRPSTEVIAVDAKPVNSSNRMIGDIGIRAYSHLKRKALEIISQRKVDFIWIPIPSFYMAPLGRQLYEKTFVPYGIDYIDPWVDSFVGQNKLFSKAWFSNLLAKLLEPYAVKKAALISGVATSYYQPVLQRNFRGKKIEHIGMPYGFDSQDHEITIEGIEYPWAKYDKDVEAYIYAGAFLPKSHLFLKVLFQSIKELQEQGKWRKNQKLFFLGTGNYPGKSIAEYAKDYHLEEFVFEINERFPFLHILNFLSAAKGLLVLGSTEKHYTASKIFQSLLSKRPVLAIFHHQSTAIEIMKECKADAYLCTYDPSNSIQLLELELTEKTRQFFANDPIWNPDLSNLDKYSAKASTEKLVNAIKLISNEQ